MRCKVKHTSFSECGFNESDNGETKMKITQQLLRNKANGPLQSVEFLDLSDFEIFSIEKLGCCPKLQTLNLRGNHLSEVTNLEQCRNLWRIDLSNNEIKSLDCLGKFVALGTLNLANNDISWREIGKLRSLHILELSLHGNKQLEKDPYYRIHLIDCLPHVWMLDGRMITSAERLQVKHFFADSALTDHPIRRKLSKDWFVPSGLKKPTVNGIYGDKTTHMMFRFPANGPQNIDSDRRRLKYLAYNVQEDLMVEKRSMKRDFQVLKYRVSFLEDLLEIRPTDRERCNMLLLLLVATLEFVMPTHLVKETLETAKLGKIGKVYTMDLFLLPKEIRCRIVCIFLSAVKIDKDNKEDGGLYDKLYLCLFYTVAELAKLCNSANGKHISSKTKMTKIYMDYKCLLASEVVQLLCIVPAFFEYVDRDIGVMNLVVTATGDPAIVEKIVKISHAIVGSGGDIRKLYEELSDFLLQRVQEHSVNLTNKAQQLPTEDEVVSAMKAYPMKGFKSPLEAADYHAKGVTSPNLDPPSVLSARRHALKTRKHFPHLGDYLLLGPQTLGKIMGLPQPFVALVAMDSIPVANGAMESKLKQSEDHYTYVNMDQLEWDTDLSFWKPKGAIGDSMLQEFLSYSNIISRFTIHTIEDLRKELNRRANLTTDQVPRPNSPVEFHRPFTSTPGRDSPTPLIYSSGQPVVIDEPAVTKPRRTETPARPMSSLLKEKLDLKLDLTIRRSQSATERSTRSPSSPRNTPERMLLKSADSNKTLDKPDPGHEGHTKLVPECVPCAIAAALAKEQTEKLEKTDEKSDEKTDEKTVAVPVSEAPPEAGNVTEQVSSPVPSPTPIDSAQRETTGGAEPDSLALSDEEEPELQNLSTARTEAQDSSMSPSRAMSGPTTTSSILQVTIPQADTTDPDKDQPTTHKFNGIPIIKGRQTTFSKRPILKSGKLTIQNKNRPFSAVDAYKYIVMHQKKSIGTESFYTSYQQQRTEAWRQTTLFTRSATPQQQRQSTPPPQRPTSPNSRPRPASSLSITRGNDWLAGGRDLYWESMQKRPKSGHVPGWKDGLPDTLKRPKSAVASRALNRRSKNMSPVTPSSLNYERFVQGRGSPRTASGSNTTRSLPDMTQLPDLAHLSDYQPLYHHMGIPRRLGSTGPVEVSAQPTQDTVYRTPPNSPTLQRSLGVKPTQLDQSCSHDNQGEPLMSDSTEHFQFHLTVEEID